MQKAGSLTTWLISIRKPTRLQLISVGEQAVYVKSSYNPEDRFLENVHNNHIYAICFSFVKMFVCTKFKSLKFNCYFM